MNKRDANKSQKLKKKKSDKNRRHSHEDEGEGDSIDGAQININEEDDDEYDDEERRSEDDDFIADDNDVVRELSEQKRRERREFKRQEKQERKLNRKKEREQQDDVGIDEDDMQLIQDSKVGRLRKLRKTGPESDDYDDQIDQIESPGYNQKKKSQKYDLKREYEEPYYEKIGKGDIKRQLQEKRGNDSTAAEDDGHPAHLQANQSLKDKFVCEDIDDLFGTKNDTEIAEKDCPERIQIKLANRLNPTDQEIEVETDWIFSQMITSLAASKGHMELTDFNNIKTKIIRTLKFFRCENKDIPYICKYEMNILTPELEQDDVWKIFNMDIEYGKFQIQKKHCEDFFTKVSEIGSANGNAIHMEHYKNQIHHVKNQRDLNDFQPLINFYKSFYQKELEQVASKSGKKLPVPKREFVFNARQKKLDQFSRRCLLSPIQIVENINEDNQMHKPPQPQIQAVEMAKEYANQKIMDEPEGSKKQVDIYLDILKEMCLYAAAELQSQPDIRRALKKHIYDNGILQTQPTEKGKKELDVFHPSYRVKRINKKLNEMKENDQCATDIFLDVLQNESLGLITYEIVIKDDCDDIKIGNKFFQNMYEKYKYPDDSTQWNLVRREIFQLFSSINSAENKGQKSFLSSIKDEIKEELKEDAETFILAQCGEKYKDLIETGYFKVQDDQKINQIQKKGSNEDIVPQRERLCVLGAVMHQMDQRTNLCQIAIVDQFGELKEHHTFYHIIPPRKRRPDKDGNIQQARPGEIEQENKHKADRERFQNVLKDYSVDLIVVCADCLEARKLKKTLEEFANLRVNHDDNDNDDNEDKDMNDQNDDDINSKEANVIWGRPEIPKLFAQSHYSQKLLKGQPFILKKAICLARYEQDPMNEVLNLWSPIQSENQALHLNMHPNQKHINQSRLMDTIEEINIKTVNNVGIDINLLSEHEHWYNQLQFLSGLGPRKSQRFLQKYKSIGQPLNTRNDIHKMKLLKNNCFNSALGFLKIRVKNVENEQKSNILDQTRIHIRFYDKVYKLVTDFMFENQSDIEDYKKQHAVLTLIKDSEKLKEFSEGQYKEELKKIENPQITQLTHIYHQIMEELLHPFIDPREAKEVTRTPHDPKFSNEELFYCLIDETERTFKRGMIVSATVVRVFDSRPDADQKMGPRILCKLENGLDANIIDRDTDSMQNLSNVDKGSIITGRIDKIKFVDENRPNDDTFSINLNLKKKNLISHEDYVGDNDGQIPDEDLVNINFKTQEDQINNQQKHMIQKRKIQHQRFQNIASRRAIDLLMKEDVGEFYFRPSSKGDKNITLTWKFFEGNIVHIDIKELDKAPGANIGSKLQISDEVYENLQEIVERYIIPCNRSLREVINHAKFQKCNDLEELKKCLEAEKADDNSRIPYKFTVLEKYPQYLILAYIPKKDIVKEFIKVKPRGYFFHHQYHYPFQNMINWFKENFRSKDYQRYLRKTGSPQMATAGVQQLRPQQDSQNPSNMPYKSGMQIDSGGRQQWGGEGDDVKNEGSRYGQRRSPGRGGNWGQDNNDHVKDERERNNGYGGNRRDDDMQSPDSDRGGYRGRGGRGRGRGDRGGFSGGDRGDRPPMKCYNCQGEGHMARGCTEPRQERRDRGDRDDRGDRGNRGGYGGGDDRPAYKRQRRDDEEFGHKDAQSNWAQDGGQQWGNNDVKNDNQNNQNSQEGWGANSQADKPKNQNQDEGFGNANQGGWGNEAIRNSQPQNDGGWNNQ